MPRSQESERVEATFTDEGPLGISMATLRGGSLDGKVVIASSGGEEFQPDSRAGLVTDVYLSHRLTVLRLSAWSEERRRVCRGSGYERGRNERC